MTAGNGQRDHARHVVRAIAVGAGDDRRDGLVAVGPVIDVVITTLLLGAAGAALAGYVPLTWSG